MNSASEITAEVMRLARVVTDSEVAKWERQREIDLRLERIRPYASAVTAADVQRIVEGRIDTEAWRRWVERFLVRWNAGKVGYLWLCGAMGVGKTVAALGAIAQEGGRMVSSQEVARAFGQETEEARLLRPAMLETRLLVIDDGGTELDEAKARHGMHELLNKRQNRMATIITTNQSPTEARSRYDARTFERVEHQGIIVEVKGPDRRAKP